MTVLGVEVGAKADVLPMTRTDRRARRTRFIMSVGVVVVGIEKLLVRYGGGGGNSNR